LASSFRFFNLVERLTEVGNQIVELVRRGLGNNIVPPGPGGDRRQNTGSVYLE
jgi:hypothetical protein